ncbi:MAG: hypothetical protein JSS12_08915 [Verrucomicrobia bacterium]|nr:hypothetical protein [Verrucomicrobiota bacterium]
MFALYYVQQQQRAPQEAALYAKQHLAHEGVLQRKSDGFVYLKVDDAYIRKLYPMLHLKDKGYRHPPYFRSPEAPGAHISVFYVDEKVSPQEIGKVFHFEPESIEIVRAGSGNYAILVVRSPELEALRKKYGKSPKLHGHEFHISIAKSYFQ